MYSVTIPSNNITVIKQDFKDIAKSFGNVPVQALADYGIKIKKIKPSSVPVTRTSEISGVERTLLLSISPEQESAYHSGTKIQDAFPNLTDAEREFYKTGVTSEEWDSLFPPDEED